MRIVTAIEPIAGGRGRARIYLDDAFAFVLYKKEIKTHGLDVGGAVSDEVYGEILTETLPKRAKLRAMHLLEKRPYTEKGLRDKLSDGDYPAEIIDAALDYVRAFGYIDDLKYASDHIAYHSADRNRKRLTVDLLKKGVDKATIDEAFAAYDRAAAEEGDMQSGRDLEAAMIEKELRKKRFDPAQTTYEERMKIAASLARKGFDAELVRDVMGRVSKE